MTLPEQILDLQGYLNGVLIPPPQNEADTCIKVILPLLYSAGYAPGDIFSQNVNLSGTFPDFTILSSSNTWFLEAKAWSVPLINKHAAQTMGYVNGQGKRWGVLTNGQEWQLYDDAITGVPAPGRLILTALLSDAEKMLEFMTIIGKSSMTSNSIVKSVLQQRLKSRLESEFLDPNSDLIKAMRTSLRSNYKLLGVQGTDIVLALQPTKIPAGSPALPTPHSPLPPVIANVTTVPHTATNSIYTLKDLADMKQHNAGMKPNNVKYETGEVVVIRNWCDLAESIVNHLVQIDNLPPMPFTGRGSGSEYLINTTPIHSKGGQLKRHRKIVYSKGIIYLHIDRSASDFVFHLCALCTLVGLDPNQITVYF